MFNDDAPLEGDGIAEAIARHNATVDELAHRDPREVFVEEDFSYVPGDYDKETL